ncbi:MAG: 60S ribosomal export protein NMD3 [Candidatus Hadarchaeales archaeon]
MVRKRFCYRCGAGEESGPLIDGLCSICYSAENALVQAPGETEVLLCESCGSHLVGKAWKRPSGRDPVESAMVDAALSALRIAVTGPSGVTRVPLEQASSVRVEAKAIPERKQVRITAHGRVHELQPEVAEEVAIGVKVKRGKCDACRLRRSGRFEAILQVRGELDPKRISEVKEMVGESVRGAEPLALVSRVIELREGLDFYVHPAGVARQVALRMKSKFGAEVKESVKLVGQTKDGRRRYRYTFLVRL